MKTAATTVEDYLEQLPAERRAVIAAVREIILRHLPAGYHETINWGMISYEIPLERYPTTYNHQPLAYIGLAAQKQYYALHLMSVYGDAQKYAQIQQAFAEAGKRFDMGKGCLRFRRFEDVPWTALGPIIASVSPDAYIAHYEAARNRS